ncbi:RagB/SusD family nutrient uptake outer membrane protein [Maribellus comscasis]|uniref:RagB/SusD family nutrient uptake outer membrane protein n=1 Tax=Maribellus comscasis TaxID=2681766 RepID=A0A6I6JMT5_9BACT|nr:RagB/SusD family nutrient uptake outer membrane protein [Maribellus comscasis]QGY42419.1 RagB/SusD family nutrient uptake outer membrane protein [Maribellus comscasis]
MKTYIKLITASLFISFIFLTSCEEGILDKQPLSQLSTENFWTTPEDAELALAGVYNKANTWSNADHICEFDDNTDNGIDRKPNQSFLIYGNLNPSSSEVKSLWNNSYEEIAGCNYFLENIETIEDMDSGTKAEMIAEVRFLRAFAYFNMSQYWGGVPLVTKLLTMEESITINTSSKSDIVDFVLSELEAITNDLPVTRSSDQHGRIVRAAALGVKGRLLMAEERWGEAATAFKAVIDLGVHEIDPLYSELFNGKNEESSEIIFSRKYLAGEIANSTQLYYRPSVDGGWHHMNPFQSLVDAYLCTDGKTIEESELYDPQSPVVKDGVNYRDPRLLYTIFYPGISTINGRVYHGHPDSTSVVGDVFTYDAGMTGYCLQKYVDNEYTGDVYSSGVDIPIIRYAEILLSYLECKINEGTTIDQSLLDLTINAVRGREAVQMPSVTETDATKLMEILKRERRVELAWEGLRYWDLNRWGEATDKLSDKPMYGIKLTDDPDNYDRFPVGPNGHYFVFSLQYSSTDLPWPFPQDELDINTTLTQKDNWK